MGHRGQQVALGLGRHLGGEGQEHEHPEGLGHAVQAVAPQLRRALLLPRHRVHPRKKGIDRHHQRGQGLDSGRANPHAWALSNSLDASPRTPADSCRPSPEWDRAAAEIRWENIRWRPATLTNSASDRPRARLEAVSPWVPNERTATSERAKP